MTLIQNDEGMRRLLQEARTIAVVGYSERPDRPSNQIAHYLKRAGYTVYLVNPSIDEDNGERVYPTLAALPEKVDIVDVFRRPEYLAGVVDDAITAGAKAVWAQLGIASDEAAQKAQDAGLELVMDRCIKVDHRRLLG